jgi:hypothetical protein
MLWRRIVLFTAVIAAIITAGEHCQRSVLWRPGTQNTPQLSAFKRLARTWFSVTVLLAVSRVQRLWQGPSSELSQLLLLLASLLMPLL